MRSRPSISPAARSSLPKAWRSPNSTPYELTFCPRNGRRIVRALEILAQGERTHGAALPDAPIPWRSATVIGLALARPALIALFTVGWGFVHPLASGQSGARAQLGRAQSSALYQLAWLTGTAVFGWLIGLVMDAAGWGGAVAGFLVLTVLGAAAAWIGLETLRGRRPSPPAA